MSPVLNHLKPAAALTKEKYNRVSTLLKRQKNNMPLNKLHVARRPAAAYQSAHICDKGGGGELGVRTLVIIKALTAC